MGSTCAEGSGQNDQKLHENYKISILGAKQCGEAWGAQVNFLGNGGIRKKKTLEVIERIKTILSTFI